MSRITHPIRLPSGPTLRLLARCVLGLLLIVSVAGCNSRANPMNWFGNETVIVRSDEAGPEPEDNPLIPEGRSSVFNTILGDGDNAEFAGTPIAQVTELIVDRAQGGAVIRATGIAFSLGAFAPRLVPVPSGSDDVLRLEFRAAQPQNTQGRGTDRARTVTTAVRLSDQTLAFVRVIEVVAVQNERSVRR